MISVPVYAFVERLDPAKQYLIVRAGPDATEYRKPYKKSCLGEIDGDSVTLMAFCEPWWVQLLRRWFPRIVGSLVPYVRASVRSVLADGFEEVHLDRAGQNPRRLVFTKGENGEIRMSKVKKEAIRPVKDIFKADGTLNVPEATFGLAHAMGQDAAGHISITHGSATEHANADGSVDVVIKFRREHH